MLYSNECIANVVENVARHSAGFIPFGKRFPLDRRYRIFAIAGHGNGTIDTTYGHVGDVQFKLFVDRSRDFVQCTALDRKDYFRI